LSIFFQRIRQFSSNMKLFTFLTAAVLPIASLAGAIPAAPLDASVVAREEPGVLPKAAEPVMRDVAKMLLAPRQTNLSDLLSGILPAIKAVGELLQTETIENIKTTIDGLAVVLGNGRADKTGNLLDQVGGLLNEDLINQIKDVLPSIGSLLNKENIDIISSLLGTAGGLLSEENVKKIVGLVNNASNLLSENFVKQTVGLINDVAPVRTLDAVPKAKLRGVLTENSSYRRLRKSSRPSSRPFSAAKRLIRRAAVKGRSKGRADVARSADVHGRFHIWEGRMLMLGRSSATQGHRGGKGQNMRRVNPNVYTQRINVNSSTCTLLETVMFTTPERPFDALGRPLREGANAGFLGNNVPWRPCSAAPRACS
jgi:hypothetical protein